MIALLLGLLACGGAERATCSADTLCPFGSVCVEGVCELQACATSDQCAIEQYCLSGQCIDGCAEDTDCVFGSTCDAATATCVEAACADTHVDCAFGEFCASDGECVEAGGAYCRACEDDGDCGGGGNLCIGGYCGVTCAADHECPAGYDCAPIGDLSGNIVSYQCLAACWLDGESP